MAFDFGKRTAKNISFYNKCQRVGHEARDCRVTKKRVPFAKSTTKQVIIQESVEDLIRVVHIVSGIYGHESIYCRKCQRDNTDKKMKG